MVAAGFLVAKRNNSKEDPIVLALIAGGAYTFISHELKDSF